MKHLLSLPLLLAAVIVLNSSLKAQPGLPVLKTNATVLSIRDGDTVKKDYWYLDSELEVDVYAADKTPLSKTVSFCSDIDTVSFFLSPNDSFDFLIVIDEKDTCYTRIKSGLTRIDPQLVEQKQDTIPFTLTDDNNILIETILNEKDTVQMMFHTAQSTVGLTFDAIERIGADHFDKQVEAESWGGKGTGSYSRGNHIQVQNFEWTDVTVWAGEHSGPGSDGKFGPNLFAEKVIELNFDKKIMVIHARLPDAIEGYEKMALQFQDHMMFVETDFSIDGVTHTRRALLHSGYAGTLLLDEEYVDQNNLRQAIPVSRGKDLKDSYGHAIETEKATLPEFSVGSETFQNMPIGFFAGKIGGDSRSVMGGNLIKRFNMYLDLQNAFIYLQPSALFGTDFEKS